MERSGKLISESRVDFRPAAISGAGGCPEPAIQNERAGSLYSNISILPVASNSLRCHYDKVYLVCVVYFVLVIELKHYALFEAVDLLDASTHDILNVKFLYLSIPYYIYIFDRLYFLRKIS